MVILYLLLSQYLQYIIMINKAWITAEVFHESIIFIF